MTLHNFWGFNDNTGAMDPPMTGTVTYNASGRNSTGGLTANSSGTFFALASGQSTVIVGAALRPSTANNAADLFQFREGTTVHCRVSTDTSGRLLIKGAANTTLATSTFAWTFNNWVDNIEVKAVIHDTTGSVEVRAFGVVVVSATNIDTKNGATGVVDNVGLFRAPSDLLVDDVYICDGSGSSPYNTYLGDVHVRTLVPTGAGDSTQWTPSTGSNWAAVDETNASTTDYVSAATASLTDLYAITDIPTTDLPLATMTGAWAAKTDAGTPPTIKSATKGDGGTVVDESAMLLSTTYSKQIGAVRTTDPDGDALTAARVNATQLGVRSS